MKILKITELIENVDNYSYHFNLVERNEETGEEVEKISGDNSVLKVEGEDLNKTLRKIADNDIEIFVNENSIGFGALNHGVGMTEAELEAKAETPEQD